MLNFFKKPHQDVQAQIAANKGLAFKYIVLAAFGSMVIMLMTAAIISFARIQPLDDTIVPSVVGLSLTEAMLVLQEHNLTAAIETRFSENLYDEGLILSQSPQSGIHVKVGRNITLIVNRGNVVNIVEDFTGFTLNEVRSRINIAYAGGQLQIEEPIVYVISDRPVGTVVGQSPSPDTQLTGPTSLRLSVSRGNILPSQNIASYIGLTYVQTLALLAEAGIPFNFVSSGNHDNNATVVSQSPASGGALSYGQVLTLVINEPNNVGNRIFGFVEFTLPDSPLPLPIRIIEHHPNLGDLELFSGELPGATIRLPYLATPGSQIIAFSGTTPLASHAVD
ncbi:MAG: PASTA domain-containing protein [Spirochaetaceae bacterium]|nr:PASTA domain-containing protein [Spirochaetaceae bacterium]